MALIHLIYVSSARIELATGELTRVLEASVRHHTPVGVTGMLLYLGGNFMQVLEGEEAVVDETYKRLRKDPRHTDVWLLDRSPIAARSFARWKMGFKHLTPADLIDCPAYAPCCNDGFDAEAMGAKQGLAFSMLQQFALSQPC
jgi:hypothetical protein